LKSDDDGPFDDEPTGQFPVASSSDPRVTITGAEIASEIVDEPPTIDPNTLLPHWTDAPTGQVPIVVARETAKDDDPWSAVPAPAWREGEADWVAHEGQFDASFLAGEAKADDARPWEFSLSEETTVEDDDDPVIEAPRPAPLRSQRTRQRVSANPLAGRAVRQGSNNVSLATLTGHCRLWPFLRRSARLDRSHPRSPGLCRGGGLRGLSHRRSSPGHDPRHRRRLDAGRRRLQQGSRGRRCGHGLAHHLRLHLVHECAHQD
jgi:hypothetical protein